MYRFQIYLTVLLAYIVAMNLFIHVPIITKV